MYLYKSILKKVKYNEAECEFLLKIESFYENELI